MIHIKLPERKDILMAHYSIDKKCTLSVRNMAFLRNWVLEAEWLPYFRAFKNEYESDDCEEF